MSKFSSLQVVDFDDLFKGITKQVVVLNFVSDLELAFFKLDLSGLTLCCWLALGLGVSFYGWVEDLIELWFVLTDDIRCPLAKVGQVVNYFKLI
jgi:hypothetical protein